MTYKVTHPNELIHIGTKSEAKGEGVIEIRGQNKSSPAEHVTLHNTPHTWITP